MIPHEHGPEQLPEPLVLGGQGEAAGKAHAELALLFAQGGLVVGAVEAAQVLDEGAQEGHAAVVESERGVPCGFGIGKMAAHFGRIQELGLHVRHIGFLFGTDAGFPLAVERNDRFPAEFGVAEPESIVERLVGRPLFGPVVLFAEEIEERGVQAV